MKVFSNVFLAYMLEWKEIYKKYRLPFSKICVMQEDTTKIGRYIQIYVLNFVLYLNKSFLCNYNHL